jgi:Ca2+-binding RTX toxin-like protein
MRAKMMQLKGGLKMPCRKITHCPKIERLERRRLLAAAFDASTNTLTVTGTEAADDISVEAFSSSARVTANGVTDEFYPAQIEHVKIFALGGADHVQFDTSPSSSGKTVELTTDLGSGNDTFTATGGAVTVNGGAGDDTVTGSYYRDLLNGGDGNDSLNGSWGIDTVNGNAGTDAGFNDGLDALVSIENKIDAKGSGQVTADGTLLIQGTNGADQLSL